MYLIMGEGGTFQLFYNIKKESFAGGGRGFNIYNIYIEISHRFQYIYYILKTSLGCFAPLSSPFPYFYAPLPLFSLSFCVPLPPPLPRALATASLIFYTHKSLYYQ